MNRDKQIEEMARDICRHYEDEGVCKANLEFDKCDCECWTGTYLAPTLYEAGYRKQDGSFSRPHENDREWISVEERLPEDGGEVLIYGDKVGIYTAYYDLGYGFYGFGDPDECSRIDNSDVTHWMPLPEPPKKGGGE